MRISDRVLSVRGARFCPISRVGPLPPPHSRRSPFCRCRALAHDDLWMELSAAYVLWTDPLCEFPIFAVQRLPCGSWLVRALMGDPLLPAVVTVAVIETPSNRRRRRRLSGRAPPCSRRRALLSQDSRGWRVRVYCVSDSRIERGGRPRR